MKVSMAAEAPTWVAGNGMGGSAAQGSALDGLAAAEVLKCVGATEGKGSALMAEAADSATYGPVAAASPSYVGKCSGSVRPCNP